MRTIYPLTGRCIRNLLFSGTILVWFASSVLGSGGHAPAEDSHGAAEDAGHGDTEGHEEEGAPSNRIVIVEPRVKLDPELAAEEVLSYYESGYEKWQGGDIVFAEKYFAAALGVLGDIPEKENVLSNMGALYNERGMFVKAAAVYERLIREFPEGRKLPDIYMELGMIYRKLGALELAIAKFFSVMTSSLNISFDQMEKYKALTLSAKIEIARTHKLGEQFRESYDMYKDLLRLDLRASEHIAIHYEICYLLFELEDYQKGLSQMKLFLELYPESYHFSEIRYLLAKSYERLDRKPEALQEVVQILQRESDAEKAQPEIADYWKQRTGNELANVFYEKGDYRSALAIYQALARYSDQPEWRWPAIHQIGLCFERLGLPEKAKMAYAEILEPASGPVDGEALTDSLESLLSMAKWRLEHLNWEDDLMARLNVLRTQ